jgi:hypothetical protein
MSRIHRVFNEKNLFDGHFRIEHLNVLSSTLELTVDFKPGEANGTKDKFIRVFILDLGKCLNLLIGELSGLGIVCVDLLPLQPKLKKKLQTASHTKFVLGGKELSFNFIMGESCIRLRLPKPCVCLDPMKRIRELRDILNRPTGISHENS